MKQIEYFFNQYIFIGNILLFFCFFQSNMLMLRLLNISAYIFFLIFPLTFEIINLDFAVFTTLFILINIAQSIPLIQALVPPKLNSEQRIIYRNHFQNYLSPVQLFDLLTVHRKKIYRVSSLAIKFSNEFNSIFFIAKIGKNCKCILKGRRFNLPAPEYSWIGIPEYLSLMSKGCSLKESIDNFNTGEWQVGLNIEISHENSSFRNDKLIKENFHNVLHLDNSNINEPLLNRDNSFVKYDEDSTVIIYEFDLRKIDELFSNSPQGPSIMRGLHSIWLKYCSDVVRRIDYVVHQSAHNFKKMSLSSVNDSNTFNNPKKISLSDKFDTNQINLKKDLTGN